MVPNKREHLLNIFSTGEIQEAKLPSKRDGEKEQEELHGAFSNISVLTGENTELLLVGLYTAALGGVWPDLWPPQRKFLPIADANSAPIITAWQHFPRPN